MKSKKRIINKKIINKKRNKHRNNKDGRQRNKGKNKQKGGDLPITANSGTDGSITVLTNNIINIVASVVNTFIDTGRFIKDTSSFKGSMNSEFSSTDEPGANN